MVKYTDDGDYIDLDMMPFARVSTDRKRKEIRYDNHKKKVWHLEIGDFVKKIDPRDYFVTTGEAVTKARRLEQDLLEAYQRAKLMTNILQDIRGDNVYLETRWINHQLTLHIKNPRKRKKKVSNDTEATT